MAKLGDLSPKVAQQMREQHQARADRRCRDYLRGVDAAREYMGGIPHQGAWREAERLKIRSESRADFIAGFLSELTNISREPVDITD